MALIWKFQCRPRNVCNCNFVTYNTKSRIIICKIGLHVSLLDAIDLFMFADIATFPILLLIL